MRNLWSSVVNWIAALFGFYGGTPHPIVATDDVGPHGQGPTAGR